ncbi:hypothetical protein M9458_055073 [Cirrhinus mrigala]|uniref:Uncharacterized protein n=1 Tax=Cirrhinus mrigala TaxID=683832 RepID=A0ABD0ML04_CIRMR
MGQPSAPCGSGPAAAEARGKLNLRGSQVDLTNKLDKGLSLSRSSTGDESELFEDDNVISLTSSDPAASALKPPAPRMMSCWRLWNTPRQGWICRGNGLKRFQHTSYANIEGMGESGYERMPIEETLASYLSLGEASSLKAFSLPSEPLQQTSSLNGGAYAAAGQAAGQALHTMAVLQADLLKDLNKGQGLSPDEVAELCRTTDLALWATKQAATAMGRSMVAIVVTERHLWVNLADLGKKEKGFLLNAPVSPSELFGTSVEMVRGLGRRRCALLLSKPLFFEGPGLSPNIKGVQARPVL